MRAQMSLNAASARAGLRTKAGHGSPIRTTRAARPGARWSGARRAGLAANVPASDPMVTALGDRRGDRRNRRRHGADGLASGSATACGADLDDADDGGTCGSVRYCVGAGCETVSPQSNVGFVNATTRLNMALELGGEEFDRDDMRFFTGQRRRCHIHFGGSGQLLQELGACWSGSPTARPRSASWPRSATPATPTISAATARSARSSASASAARAPGACSARSSGASCSSRAVPSSASAGRAAGASQWRKSRASTSLGVDLSEFTQELMDGSREPVGLAAGCGRHRHGDAPTRIRDFYSRGQ